MITTQKKMYPNPRMFSYAGLGMMKPIPSMMMKNIATMMFAQRFALYGNSTERNTMKIGIIIMIAIIANISSVNGMSMVPFMMFSNIPGSIYRMTSP